MTDSYLAQVRSYSCKRDSSGRWLCARCQAALAEADVTQCPSCVELAQAEERMRRRQEWETEQRHLATAPIGMLPRWQHITTRELAAPTMDRRLVVVAEKWTPEKGSLLLCGPSGVGKTTSIARAVHRLGDQRLAVRLAQPNEKTASVALREHSRLLWTDAWALARALSQHRLGAGHEAELLTNACDAPLLFLDELGPEPPQHAGAIFDVIDRRSKHCRPTVVTTGLQVAQLEARYGSGFTRRLKEKGLGTLIDLHPPERGTVG